MTLAANAITTVAKVQDFTGISQVLSDAFEIYNNSGSNTTATVAVSDTTLVTVGSTTGTDTFTLANAATDTMAELTAAITALAEGWQVNLLCAGTVVSDLLIPLPAQSAYGQSNTLRLQFNNTGLLEELINRASDAIENYLNTVVKAQTDLRQYFDSARKVIRANNWPLTSVSRIAYGSETAFSIEASDSTDLRATVEVQDDQIALTRINSAGASVAVTRLFSASATASALVTYINTQAGWSATLEQDCPTADLWRMAGKDALTESVDICFPPTTASAEFVDEEAGLIHLVYPICERGQIIHNAGYSTIPDDIEHACIMLVQELYNARSRDSGLQSESIGSYSYTRVTPAAGDAANVMTPTIKALLAPYKRPIVG